MCPKNNTVEQVSFAPPPRQFLTEGLPVLQDIRRCEIPGNFSGSGLGTLGIVSPHPRPIRGHRLTKKYPHCVQTWNCQASPPDQNLPRIVFRLYTLENGSKIYRQAFPPGEHLTVPLLPNVTAVNALGDFSIARDQLAITDGDRITTSEFHILHRSPPHCCCGSRTQTLACICACDILRRRSAAHFLVFSHPVSPCRVYLETNPSHTVDPWRPTTPHSDYYARDRLDTSSQPFKIIPSTSLVCSRNYHPY